jgi:hypothetical protein
MVRLDALQVPTFRVTMYGGSLFRASISAVPFLLPLLFQVGFGMDPFIPACWCWRCLSAI